MRFLLIVDFALAAFGAAMAIGVGFVALVYLIYGHSQPRMQAGLPGVAIMTGCFVALCLFGLSAGLLLKRRRTLHWPAQALLFGALPWLWRTVFQHLQTP